MSGGTGDDTYFVDNAGDEVIEASGEGRDVVYTSVTYSSPRARRSRCSRPSPSPATGALELIGNGFGQEIYGNAGANFLDGGGGTDYLIGLGGNDIYFVDGRRQWSSRAPAAAPRRRLRAQRLCADRRRRGRDPARRSSQDATTALTLIGNGFGQEIYGNAGANFIDGGGGADFLVGLGGNDVYVVDSAERLCRRERRRRPRRGLCAGELHARRRRRRSRCSRPRRRRRPRRSTSPATSSPTSSTAMPAPTC